MPTNPKVAERQAQALELRKQGFSIRAIAQKLEVSAATIQNDLNSALLEVTQLQFADLKKIVFIETLRLDSLFEVFYAKAILGDGDSLDRVLSIMTRRAKLLGLDAVQKVEIQVKSELSKVLDALEKKLSPAIFDQVCRIVIDTEKGTLDDDDGEGVAAREFEILGFSKENSGGESI